MNVWQKQLSKQLNKVIKQIQYFNMLKQTLILLFGILLLTVSATAQDKVVEAIVPVSTPTVGEFKYTTKMNMGGQDMEFDVERTIKEEDGKIVITDNTSTPFGAMENTSVLEKESLLTISQSSTGMMTSNIDFSGEKILGETADFRGNKTPVDVEKKGVIVYGSGSAGEAILAGLPLEIGYKTSMYTFVPQQMEVVEMQVEVVEKESIEVAGGIFEAYRLDIVLPEMEGFQQSVWIPIEAPRMVVKSVMNIPNMGEMVTEYAGEKGAKKKKKKKN